jgi:hypothetical protein
VLAAQLTREERAWVEARLVVIAEWERGAWWRKAWELLRLAGTVAAAVVLRPRIGRGQ